VAGFSDESRPNVFSSCITDNLITSEVLTAIVTTLMKFWALMPCGFEGRFRRFGETYCLYLQGLKWQGREVDCLYRIWRAKAEGREPIKGKEYGIKMRTNRVPSGRSLQSLKMETSCSSETLASTYKFPLRQNPRLLHHNRAFLARVDWSTDYRGLAFWQVKLRTL
jgi:hypothetical protein